MAGADYYDILGVSRNASDEEIKRAYRRLAKQYHPDRTKNDPAATAKFKEVSEAYEVLSDKQKRAQYDQFGKAGVGHVEDHNGRKVYTWGGGSSTIDMDDLEDLFSAFGSAGPRRRAAGGGPGDVASIFEQMFGGRGNGPRVDPAGWQTRTAPRRAGGQNVERPVRLTFEQAIQGATVEIDRAAGGRRETISVRIPPGVSDGQRIRLRGQGGPGRGGGPAGDLLIVCQVQPHRYFRRAGNDIVIDVPISIQEAVLGGTVDVPTLHGTMTMKVPPGVASGTRLRLKGKGVPAGDGRPLGDQYAVIQIVPPKNLTNEQKQAFERLAGEIEYQPRREVAWNES